MSRIYVNSIGVIGPGLLDWKQTAAILRGDDAYEKTEVQKFAPNLLRPNERRRTTALIKLALQVAEQAVDQASVDSDKFCSVFSSSEGDSAIVDNICDALTQPERPVSPTKFHNSVHNAPAGYWAIATHSHMPSNSICAGYGSLAAGLLESAGLAHTEKQAVLLVCYDYPAPPPLLSFVGIEEPFASAWLLSHESTSETIAGLSVAITRQQTESKLKDPDLEQLCASNPAAYALPLLQAIAAGKSDTVILPYLDGLSLEVSVSTQ